MDRLKDDGHICDDECKDWAIGPGASHEFAKEQTRKE